MNLRHRKPRPLKRDEMTYRDDRLIIIATEDTLAPNHYFRLFRNPRVKVQVLPTDAGLSAPEHVMARLDEYRNEYDLMEEDELWLSLDTDHWTDSNHVSNFKRVCREAKRKGYQMAHSNPCFEIWLLLHVVDLDANERFTKCDAVVGRLRSVLGEYSKRTIDVEHFPPDSVRDAIERAKRLDISPGDRWPQVTGTHVYRIIERMWHEVSSVGG